MVAVLANVRSIHNVGSIFRTADGVGIAKIYLCGITPTPFDRLGKLLPQFAKVALGAERLVPWEHACALIPLLKKLEKDGYRLYAVEQDKRSVPYARIHSKKLPSKIALIVGSETRGVPKSALALVDTILEIPMRGKKESLNVSVAFGIAAYQMAAE